MAIRCFLIEPTELTGLWLRRYTKSQYVDDPDRPGHAIETNSEARRCPNMPGSGSYHTAREPVAECRSTWDAEAHRWTGDGVPTVEDLIADPRWPKRCACGYEFCACGDPGCIIDAYQVFTEQIYRRAADTGEETNVRDAPAGALWYADWLPVDRWKGPDGRTLMCKTPGGDWIIDGVASNCTLPDDKDHRCWMRHGTPPNITVDKNPEPPFTHTCAAGAGSIQAGDYHGFLQNGHLT